MSPTNSTLSSTQAPAGQKRPPVSAVGNVDRDKAGDQQESTTEPGAEQPIRMEPDRPNRDAGKHRDRPDRPNRPKTGPIGEQVEDNDDRGGESEDDGHDTNCCCVHANRSKALSENVS